MIAISSWMPAALSLLLFGASLEAQSTAPGAYFVPGDPKAGMQTFLEKGCGRCHSVLGEGGRTAPDLARAPAGHLSAAELVAAMWNHAPAMWQRMRLERLIPPKFSDDEMTNLFAFLDSVRSLDEAGDPERGRKLLSEKRCLDCHAIYGQGGRVGPDLKTWTTHRNPVSWIQAMWNHGRRMQTMMAERGLSWPQFQGGEMTDIIAYLRTMGGGSRVRAHLRFSNPEAGKRLFQHKGCSACHAIRGAGGSGAPDLGARSLPRTLGQFAALMWNHAPEMWTRMRVQGVLSPEFSNQEMADLLAYFFTDRYFEAAGDIRRGQRVFDDKGCGGCHSSDIGPGRGPKLTGRPGITSPVRMAAALWNHGPLMHESMRQRQIPWPRFRPREITDLMEFLSRGQPAKELAGGKP